MTSMTLPVRCSVRCAARASPTAAATRRPARRGWRSATERGRGGAAPAAPPRRAGASDDDDVFAERRAGASEGREHGVVVVVVSNAGDRPWGGEPVAGGGVGGGGAEPADGGFRVGRGKRRSRSSRARVRRAPRRRRGGVRGRVPDPRPARGAALRRRQTRARHAARALVQAARRAHGAGGRAARALSRRRSRTTRRATRRRPAAAPAARGERRRCRRRAARAWRRRGGPRGARRLRAARGGGVSGARGPRACEPWTRRRRRARRRDVLRAHDAAIVALPAAAAARRAAERAADEACDPRARSAAAHRVEPSGDPSECLGSNASGVTPLEARAHARAPARNSPRCACRAPAGAFGFRRVDAPPRARRARRGRRARRARAPLLRRLAAAAAAPALAQARAWTRRARSWTTRGTRSSSSASRSSGASRERPSAPAEASVEAGASARSARGGEDRRPEGALAEEDLARDARRRARRAATRRGGPPGRARDDAGCAPPEERASLSVTEPHRLFAGAERDALAAGVHRASCSACLVGGVRRGGGGPSTPKRTAPKTAPGVPGRWRSTRRRWRRRRRARRGARRWRSARTRGGRARRHGDDARRRGGARGKSGRRPRAAAETAQRLEKEAAAAAAKETLLEDFARRMASLAARARARHGDAGARSVCPAASLLSRISQQGAFTCARSTTRTKNEAERRGVQPRRAGGGAGRRRAPAPPALNAAPERPPANASRRDGDEPTSLSFSLDVSADDLEQGVPPAARSPRDDGHRTQAGVRRLAETFAPATRSRRRRRHAPKARARAESDGSEIPFWESGETVAETDAAETARGVTAPARACRGPEPEPEPRTRTRRTFRRCWRDPASRAGPAVRLGAHPRRARAAASLVARTFLEHLGLETHCAAIAARCCAARATSRRRSPSASPTRRRRALRWRRVGPAPTDGRIRRAFARPPPPCATRSRAPGCRAARATTRWRADGVCARASPRRRRDRRRRRRRARTRAFEMPPSASTARAWWISRRVVRAGVAARRAVPERHARGARTRTGSSCGSARLPGARRGARARARCRARRARFGVGVRGARRRQRRARRRRQPPARGAARAPPLAPVARAAALRGGGGGERGRGVPRRRARALRASFFEHGDGGKPGPSAHGTRTRFARRRRRMPRDARRRAFCRRATRRCARRWTSRCS